MLLTTRRFIHTMINRLNIFDASSPKPYRAWGIFAIITYPLYYFISAFLTPESYESLPLRLVAVLLAIPLVFVNRWPNRLHKYLPIYWYAQLTYTIPFLFTFIFLKNNCSALWVFYLTTVIALSALLMEWLVILIIIPLGILIAFAVFLALGNTFVPPGDPISFITVYLAILIQGAIFAHRKDVLHEEKMRTMQSLSSNIAHELRTPLRSIGAGVNGIKLYLPALLESYNAAKNANIKIPAISQKNFDLLHATCDGIESEINSAFTTIDVLLANTNLTSLKSMELKICSMKECIDTALNRYPFDIGETDLIHINEINEFQFLGNKTALTHVLFNLFKNALYFIHASAKPDARIMIWTSETDEFNCLHFKDTGSGINKNALPHIFEQFSSNTRHGSGIGLPYCKYVMSIFNGEISCQSTEGQYAEFILKFPKV